MVRSLAPLLVMLPAFWLGLESSLSAQVDESLVTKTWKTDNFWAETYDRPFVTGGGTLENTGEHFQMFHWDSKGRIKFDDRDLDPQVWLGYRALTISVDSDREVLDHSFGDVALAVAVKLGSFAPDWEAAASAGLGTANDGRWDNPHALFPVATLEFTHMLEERTFWHLGLSLDGNRGLFQGAPLPYLLYETEPTPNLTLWLGFPRTEVVLRPWGPLVILSAQWEFPSQAAARIEVDLGAGFSVFSAVNRRIDGFHLRYEERERLFFEVQTAEVGVRWVTTWMDLSFSAGTTFGSRYFTGDDLGHRTRGSGIDDLPFIALTFPSTFWAAPFSSGVKR